jgi:hypothetical protein
VPIADKVRRAVLGWVACTVASAFFCLGAGQVGDPYVEYRLRMSLDEGDHVGGRWALRKIDGELFDGRRERHPVNFFTPILFASIL